MDWWHIQGVSCLLRRQYTLRTTRFKHHHNIITPLLFMPAVNAQETNAVFAWKIGVAYLSGEYKSYVSMHQMM